MKKDTCPSCSEFTMSLRLETYSTEIYNDGNSCKEVTEGYMYCTNCKERGPSSFSYLYSSGLNKYDLVRKGYGYIDESGEFKQW